MNLPVYFVGLSTLFFALIMPVKALAFSEFKKYAENLWEFEVTSSSYQTQNNYLRSGNSFDSLPAGYSFQLINLNMGVRKANAKWGIYSEGQSGFAQSKDPIQSRTNSQFHSILLGGDFLLLNGGFKLIPDLQFVLPIVRNDANTVQSYEGATETYGRLIGLFQFSHFHNQVFMGFAYRDGGRSALLKYGVGTDFDFGGWSIGADINGFSSIIEDKETATPSNRETVPYSVNGKSAKFNTVNPALLESNIWYKLETPKWTFQLGAGASVTGTNTAAGQQYFTSLIYHFQSENKSTPVKNDIHRFQEQTDDGVDQVLFKQQTAPADSNKEEAPQKKKPKVVDPKDSQIQIELKRAKKIKK